MDPSSRITFDFAVGTVLEDATPRGYSRLERRAVVGGPLDLERLGAAVLDWQVQRRSGIAVRTVDGADAPPVVEGFTGAVVIRLLRVVPIIAPVVVTRVIREPDRIGFVYATLLGHPEVGEEAFLIRRAGPETLIELRALSRPAFPYSLAAPVGRALQRGFTQRYLRSLVR